MAGSVKGQLKRNTALAKKRTKPRRTTSPRCKTARCNKAERIEGWCLTHAMTIADRRFSKFVRERDGRCTAEGMFGIECNGPLAAAHIVGRRNYAVRYSPDNCHALCNWGHHIAVDQAGREGHKQAWAVSVLGKDRYLELMESAIEPGDRIEAIAAALAWLKEVEA